nr:MAG TPA: hypothetical protein [Caudoviricetes sp.]
MYIKESYDSFYSLNNLIINVRGGINNAYR